MHALEISMSNHRTCLSYSCLLIFCLLTTAAQVSAQQKPETPPLVPDQDVIRISTELVQTDVVVVDKQGQFVDGLKPEQFTLKVDGKSQPIAFFERITAGSAAEQNQLHTGRASARITEDATVRGRTILFFIDDMHLSVDSINRVRNVLRRFIEQEMSEDDLVAIASPTGNIGFLQQFTNNKTVLRAAVARLTFQPFIVSDTQRPAMNEFQAQAIDRGEKDVMEQFIEQMLRENPRMLRSVAEALTMQRATQLLTQSSFFTKNMLGSLENLMRNATLYPGRKLAFFFSDGFFLDRRNSNTQDRMNMVTTIAARAGVVIYTLDARGLVTLAPDPTQAEIFDPYGKYARVTATATIITTAQDALNTLAENTGGRMFANSNALETGVRAALAEISNYYLLAWRPDAETNRGGKFRRLEVNVIGRPELKVRSRQGFLNDDVKPGEKQANKTATTTTPASTANDELRAALNDLTLRKGLPTFLSVNYVDLPEKVMMLTIAMKIPGDALSYQRVGDKLVSDVDVLGAVFDIKGQPVSTIQDKLAATVDSIEPEKLRAAKTVFTSQATVTPGLYQVRLAARDAHSKLIGTATEWIEVPDLTKGQLNMSGLFTTEVKSGLADGGGAEVFRLANLNIDRRLTKGSRLLFLTYIYNASRGAAGTGTPDLAVRIEVTSDTKTLIRTDWLKVQTEGLDLLRIPYSAEIPLTGMSPGKYTLRITTNDRVAKTTTAQSVRFMVQE